MVRVLLCSLAAALAVAAPASAASVEVKWFTDTGDGHGSSPMFTLRYLAGAGEANRLVVRRAPMGEWVFEDAGAVISAGSRCAAESEHRVVCRPGREYGMVGATLGDGDDEAHSDASSVDLNGGDGMDRLGGRASVVDGGPGDDTITNAGGRLVGGDGADRITALEVSASLDGGAGPDLLTGTDARDALSGGPGRDVVRAGGGDDEILETDGPGPPERDLIEGGDGEDVVNFWAHNGPVAVDLAAAGPEGQAPAHEDMFGIEHLVGSAHGDVLLGTDGANTIDGRDGGDRIDGRHGTDTLIGADGLDTIDGGPGADRIDGGNRADTIRGGEGDDVVEAAWDYFSDEIDCGGGADRAAVDADDRIAECEGLDIVPRTKLADLLDPIDPLERRGRRLKLQYYCVDRHDDCRGFARVAVRVSGRWRRLGTSRVYCGLTAGVGACPVGAFSDEFLLPQAAMRQLRRVGRLRVRVVTRLGERPDEDAIPLRSQRWLRRAARPTGG